MHYANQASNVINSFPY